MDERARNHQGSFKVALIKTEGSRFLVARLLRVARERMSVARGLVRTPGVREAPACTRCSSILRMITARTPQRSATGRKLSALERQRAKLVAILAIHQMSKTARL